MLRLDQAYIIAISIVVAGMAIGSGIALQGGVYTITSSDSSGLAAFRVHKFTGEVAWCASNLHCVPYNEGWPDFGFIPDNPRPKQ